MVIHKTWNICIGGFTQGTGERSGLFRLWQKMLRLRTPDVSVSLYKWNMRWSDVAEQIFLVAEDLETISINVFAYSYGGGWGFPRLARELGRRGLEINTAVLSDAVHRPRFMSLKWLALIDWPTIWVPRNVQRVVWFYQRQSRPRGHIVKAVDQSLTKVEPGIQLRMDHVYADDAPAFHRAAMEVATAGRPPGSLLKSPTPDAATVAEVKEDLKDDTTRLDR